MTGSVDDTLVGGMNSLVVDSFQNGDPDLASEDTEESEEWDSWEGSHNKGRPERWAPLGANDSDKEHSPCSGMEEL